MPSTSIWLDVQESLAESANPSWIAHFAGCCKTTMKWAHQHPQRVRKRLNQKHVRRVVRLAYSQTYSQFARRPPSHRGASTGEVTGQGEHNCEDENNGNGQHKQRSNYPECAGALVAPAR